MEPFTIKELLEHIISFVPRNIIINCALVSKSFYNGIKIDTDQESVAKNADMFSLLKIPYCPTIVINFAAQNNNVVMFEYLLAKHEIDINNSKLCRSIGQSGNEYLINKHKNRLILYSSVKVFLKAMCFLLSFIICLVELTSFLQ